MTQAPFDLDQAHRWFAIEFNNASWDLVKAFDRSTNDVERMINLAHGALAHWQKKR